MPIFTRQLDRVDTDAKKALKQMENHIRYLQEQLEYTLSNLDSDNIREIETDKTTITNTQGPISFTGNLISLTGTNGESFKAGNDTSGKFVFEIKGKSGVQCIYMNANNELIITKNVTQSIDCGEW